MNVLQGVAIFLIYEGHVLAHCQPVTVCARLKATEAISF